MILIVKELPLHDGSKEYFWDAEDILGHLLVLPGPFLLNSDSVFSLQDNDWFFPTSHSCYDFSTQGWACLRTLGTVGGALV